MFGEMSIHVIDPCNRTGKVEIPLCHVTETRGYLEAVGSKGPHEAAKDLSLCLLFQKGRCNAGARCHQIHADPVFVNKLRMQATAGSACCAVHGDFKSLGFLSTKVVVEIVDGLKFKTYPISSFARTATIDALLAEANHSGVIRITKNRICRLHQQSRCKFGKDCKNIHLCAQAQPVPVNGAAPMGKASPDPELSSMSSQQGLSTGLSVSHASLGKCSPIPQLPESVMSTGSRSVSTVSSVQSTPMRRADFSVPSSPEVSPIEPPSQKFRRSTLTPLDSAAMSFFTNRDINGLPPRHPENSPQMSIAPEGYESLISRVREELSLLMLSPEAITKETPRM